MEITYITLAFSLIACLVAGVAFSRTRQLETVGSEVQPVAEVMPLMPDQGVVELQNKMVELEKIVAGLADMPEAKIELEGKMVELEKVVAGLADIPEAEREQGAEVNPTGCTKNSHVWRKHSSLINDHEAVYHCAKNCGSTLRHRFE